MAATSPRRPAAPRAPSRPGTAPRPRSGGSPRARRRAAARPVPSVHRGARRRLPGSAAVTASRRPWRVDQEFGVTSAITTSAPARTRLGRREEVLAGTITSSPVTDAGARKAISRASVPLPTPMRAALRSRRRTRSRSARPRAEDEGGRGHHVLEARRDLCGDLSVLPAEVGEWDGWVGGAHRSPLVTVTSMLMGPAAAPRVLPPWRAG